MTDTAPTIDPDTPPILGSPGEVLAAHPWADNAAMIVDAARLGYLRTEWRTLDPTFGRGKWWTRWRPADLVAHHRPTDSTDFRRLDHPDRSFDAVAFDPPYVAKGGRSSIGADVADMDDRYGLHDAPRGPAELQQLIDDGLTEMFRLVKFGGYILAKCKNYQCGGDTYWPGVHRTWAHGERLGLTLVDEFVHLSGTGPQPGGRRQNHARSNSTALLVFRRPTARQTARAGALPLFPQ